MTQREDPELMKGEMGWGGILMWWELVKLSLPPVDVSNANVERICSQLAWWKSTKNSRLWNWTAVCWEFFLKWPWKCTEEKSQIGEFDDKLLELVLLVPYSSTKHCAVGRGCFQNKSRLPSALLGKSSNLTHRGLFLVKKMSKKLKMKLYLLIN